MDYRINAVGAGPFRLKAMLEGGDKAAAIMNVLKLRPEVEGGPKPDPQKYLDLSYYDRVLKRLAR